MRCRPFRLIINARSASLIDRDGESPDRRRRESPHFGGRRSNEAALRRRRGAGAPRRVTQIDEQSAARVDWIPRPLGDVTRCQARASRNVIPAIRRGAEGRTAGGRPIRTPEDSTRNGIATTAARRPRQATFNQNFVSRPRSAVCFLPIPVARPRSEFPISGWHPVCRGNSKARPTTPPRLRSERQSTRRWPKRRPHITRHLLAPRVHSVVEVLPADRELLMHVYSQRGERLDPLGNPLLRRHSASCGHQNVVPQHAALNHRVQENTNRPPIPKPYRGKATGQGSRRRRWSRPRRPPRPPRRRRHHPPLRPRRDLPGGQTLPHCHPSVLRFAPRLSETGSQGRSGNLFFGDRRIGPMPALGVAWVISTRIRALRPGEAANPNFCGGRSSPLHCAVPSRPW